MFVFWKKFWLNNFVSRFTDLKIPVENTLVCPWFAQTFWSSWTQEANLEQTKNLFLVHLLELIMQELDIIEEPQVRHV